MMKKIYLAVRIVLFVLILTVGTLAALVVDETPGLALADLSGEAARVTATAAREGAVYAALAAGAGEPGLYRSEDGGTTWERTGAMPGTSGAVQALAVAPAAGDDGSIVPAYAGSAGGPLFEAVPLWHSYDGGRTWQPAPLGLPASPEGILPGVTALAVDPAQPYVVYVGTDGQGVYRYEIKDGSLGYELAGGPALHSARVRSLAVGAGGRLYALTDSGLYATDGKSWQPLATPESAASLAVASGDLEAVLIGGVSTGVYRSTDGGRTWQPAMDGIELQAGAALRVTALAVDEEDPSQVAAATALGLGNQFAPDGVYMSRDGGSHWARIAEAGGLIDELTLRQGVVYVAGEDGLARYGEPAAPAAAPLALPGLSALADPSGAQVLILALSAILAALALVGPTEWLLRRQVEG